MYYILAPVRSVLSKTFLYRSDPIELAYIFFVCSQIRCRQNLNNIFADNS